MLSLLPPKEHMKYTIVRGQQHRILYVLPVQFLTQAFTECEPTVLNWSLQYSHRAQVLI